MRLVVIGGSGFIGQHFVNFAISHGHAVTIVGRRTPEVVPDGAAFISGGIEELCQRGSILEEVDAVCHLASATIPATSISDPLRDFDQNVRPMVQLLEAMRVRGNRRIMFLSSGGAVYGVPESIPIREDHPLNPISPYGVGKITIEKLLGCYTATHNFSTVSIRPANPYGPSQGKIGELGAISTFLRMIQHDETATVYGNGSTIRDFVHVRDLCRMMLQCLELDAKGVFNCGGGNGTSIRELIALIEGITGKILKVDSKPARAFDPPAIVLDISRAQEQLGWVPTVSLKEGIEELSLRRRLSRGIAG